MNYGFKSRVQSSDKNEGFTSRVIANQGTRQQTTQSKVGEKVYNQTLIEHRTAVTTRPDGQKQELDGGQRSLNAGIEALSLGISQVAGKAMDGWREQTTNKLALKAQARQGTDIAINNIDAEKKRNPLLAAFLGQSVSSRAAEAQGVQNATTRLFNKASEDMPKIAEMNTEDAMEHFANMSEDLLKEIKDPEFKEMAMDSLMAQMPNLAEAHYKERYAQQRALQVQNNKEHIINIKDAFKANMIIASGTDQQMATQTEFRKAMWRPNDPLGELTSTQDIKEQRGVVLDQMKEDLGEGDLTLYAMAVGIPEDDSDALTGVEKMELKGAIGQYDANRNQLAAGVIANAELGMMAAESYEEYLAAAQAAQVELAQWGFKASMSKKSAVDKQVREAQLEKKIQSSSSAWAKNAVDSELALKVRDYYNGEVNDQAQVVLTPKQKSEAADAQIDQYISRITGQSTGQSKETMKTAFVEGVNYTDQNGQDRFIEPVVFAKNLSEHMKNNGIPAGGFLKRFVDAQLQGPMVGQTEDGQLTPDQETQFRVAEALIAHNPSFELSANDLVKFGVYREGINKGASADFIQSQVAALQNNTGTDTSGMNKDDKMEKIKKTANSLGISSVSPSMMSEYLKEYDKHLTISNFNPKVAMNSVRQSMQQSTTQAAGINIQNGVKLNSAIGGEYDISEIVEKGSRVLRPDHDGGYVSLLTPTIMNMMGTLTDTKQQNMTDFMRANVTSMEYVPGTEFVTLISNAGTPTNIPLEEWKSISDEITKQNAIGKKTAEIQKLLQAKQGMMMSPGSVK